MLCLSFVLCCPLSFVVLPVEASASSLRTTFTERHKAAGVSTERILRNLKLLQYQIFNTPGLGY
jgi:hypothetical protein